jgi:MFS family permease
MIAFWVPLQVTEYNVLMSSVIPPDPPRAARLAVSLFFFLNGALFAHWVSRIPAVKAKLVLDEAQLGLTLLAMAVGAICSFPVTGWAIGRWGSRLPTLLGLLLMAIGLLAAGWAPSQGWLMVALLVMGMGNGGVDVAMNAQAVEVEKHYQRPILSSFHALWTLGALVGAAGGAGLTALSWSVPAHFSLVVGFTVVAAWVAYRQLLLVPPVVSGNPVFAFPPRPLWAVGFLAFFAAVAEGAMADWSAVYLRSNLQTSEAVAAVGYACFAVAMLVSRVLGDGMKQRFGAHGVALSGGLLAAVGLALGLWSNQLIPTLVGFALVGWGVAAAFPLAFSRAGHIKEVPQGVAMASVATLGYTGFLLGPPLIGFLAHQTSLQLALGAVVVAGAAVALLAPGLRE